MKLTVLCIGFVSTICAANAANILAVFPTPAYSHHVVYKVYVQALLSRCHNVTIIKPTLQLDYNNNNNNRHAVATNDTLCGKITEINADMSTKQFEKLISKSAIFRKRGVVSDVDTVIATNYKGLIEMFKDQFDNSHVKDLVRNKQTFDLIIVEAFAEYALVFGHIFSPAPVIQIAPGYGLAENFETAGAVSRHPIYYPNIWRSNFEKSHKNVLTEIKLYKEFQVLTGMSNTMLKQQFGPTTPTIQELRNNVELLLLNVHPIFDNNRPVPPSVQYLGGGLHLINASVIGLDEKLQNVMDAAIKGVIYVSFGSNIDTKTFANEFTNMLIDTFSNLHDYTILWKIDQSILQNFTLPPNVYIQNWFNQRAVLHHKNIVAFVTQGGLQSSDEAIESRVPMICLPMMGDQFYHARKLQQLGVARAMDTALVTTADLTEAVRSVINNDSYSMNIKTLKKFIEHDKVLYSPLDKAITYTERVMKYNKNKLYSLKTTAANVPYSKYYMYETIFSIVMNHIPRL
ncbi:edysteroyd udp transferase [Lonomia obliqua multiple nucleopolyhedrovirus]|uniref:Ecdysteroid UDP-glucosyltransferase n=1 Tax=Lonomia obliqua multiple nucleopolyhedrovirus TaxID=134394 RepID=A0A126FCF9_9ABAC|nr:edysteroyd udp transferase [Lonomia obliqua multiple nucleopolyhedrovirus]AKN81078.1 edysteroyd udp transferase [Lonomia obliqua multiple nucleopolyhedrovirus]